MLNALRYFGWPLLVGLLVALLIIERYPALVGRSSESFTLQRPALNLPPPGPNSYAAAVSGAAPAVANLYTTKLVEKAQQQPLAKDPVYQRFFGDSLPRQRRMESSLGSAVIMSPEGYLLTNNHVTANSEQIVVALRDGRETLARVIGSDPETEPLPAPEAVPEAAPLTVAPFAEPKPLRLGEDT